MGLSQAMFSAISGLTNHQRAMDNIGNNLANVNTVGFKKGVFQFRTLLEQTLQGGTAADATTGRGSINPLSIGLGTQTGSINKDFRQGPIEVTGNARDMAIEGNGYFVMRQGTGNVFTRDGTFYLGSDGSLLGGSGLQVQGVVADNGAIPEGANISDLIIPIGQTGAATETTKISFNGNLNSDQEVATGTRLVGTVNAPPALPWVPPTVENTDTTWDSLQVGAIPQMINGGTIQTSAALAQLTGGNLVAAGMGFGGQPDTDLNNLYYRSGTTWIQPFAGVANGDTIAINFRKGGRKQSATFTYDNTVNSNTLSHLMTFLNGGVDSPTNISNTATAASPVTNQRLQGGMMGTIKLAPKISTGDGGTSAYTAAAEAAGAYSRTGIGTVDYGAPTGIANSFNISTVSNLGAENAITEIELSFNNVKYSDIFSNDLTYSAIQGGSATTNLIAYDSLGNAKNANIQMTLVDRDTNFSTWRWVADSVDDTDADWQVDAVSGNITTSANVGTGLIRFDSEGRFVKGVELSESQGIEVTLLDQGVNNPLVVQLQEGLASTATQDLDMSVMTQVATSSDFNLKEQDGSPPGTLDSFTVTNDGVIQGVFSNGVIEALGRVSIALIPNETGMVAAGSNLYYEGASSGAASISFAGVGGRGSIRSGSLETSNVDLSEEFTRLIVTERGFQANARTITTADEMLVELVNLKR